MLAWLRWLVELDKPFAKTCRAAVIVENLILLRAWWCWTLAVVLAELLFRLQNERLDVDIVVMVEILRS
jgi:hypothetical protein